MHFGSLDLGELVVKISSFISRSTDTAGLLQSLPLLEILDLPKSDREQGFLVSDLSTIAIAWPKLVELGLSVATEEEKEAPIEHLVKHRLIVLGVYDFVCPLLSLDMWIVVAVA